MDFLIWVYLESKCFAQTPIISNFKENIFGENEERSLPFVYLMICTEKNLQCLAVVNAFLLGNKMLICAQWEYQVLKKQVSLPTFR